MYLNFSWCPIRKLFIFVLAGGVSVSGSGGAAGAAGGAGGGLLIMALPISVLSLRYWYNVSSIFFFFAKRCDNGHV